MKTFVSLIGDQTMANVLVIRDIGMSFDRHIFISTKEMEAKGKSEATLNALDGSQAGGAIRAKTIIVVVQEDSVDSIDSELSKFAFAGDEITVNITGGTKVMSIAAYNHFSKFGARMLYTTIHQNKITQIHPIIAKPVTDLRYRTNISEYCLANGIEFKPSEKQYSKEIAEKMWTHFNDGTIPKGELDWARAIRNDRSASRAYRTAQRVPNEAAKSCEILGWSEIDLEKIRFLSGEWFEYFIYHRLAEALKLEPNIAIQPGGEIKRGNSGNELDVMFLFDNAMHIVECKTSTQLDGGKSFIKEVLYKAKTIQNDFGLTVKSFIFIANNSERDAQSGELKNSTADAVKQTGIHIIDAIDLQSRESLVAALRAARLQIP